MWEKLLGLFKDTQAEDTNYVPASIAKREARSQQLKNNLAQAQHEQSSQPSQPGQGQLIGFNYLKGLEDEEDPSHSRKFINLNKLLRGDYKHEQTQETTRESESDLRRKNT